MSAWAAIATAEAIAATAIACEAILRTDRWKSSSRHWWLVAGSWRRRAKRYRAMLVAEREANLLHNQLHRRRFDADAQERTEPG